MTFESRRSYRVFLCLVAVLLAALTYLQPGTHLDLEGEMDHSWAWGINYAFKQGMVMGRDIYFTFGPLGFLEHTRMVSEPMFYASSFFSAAVSVLMNALLLHLAWKSAATRAGKITNVLMALALVIYSFPHMQRLLIVGYLAMFLHWQTRSSWYVLLQSVVIVLCLLVKFSYGIAAVSLWMGYGLVWWYRERQLKPLALAALCLAMTYLLAWGLMYGDLSAAWAYLEGGYHISQGNAAAMALNPDNHWVAISLLYGTWLLAAWMLHTVPGRLYMGLPLVFAGPLFVWTKYTFSQEQALHLVPLLDFTLYTLALFFILQTEVWKKVAMVFMAAVIAFAWKAMHTETVGSPDYVNVPHVTLNKPEVVQYRFDFSRLYRIWREAEKERLAPLRLPVRMQEVIGQATVDIYPWSLVAAAVNELNWKPRPAFQNYIAYVPFLDGKNQAFYADPDRAPTYLLWHHHQPQDIMNRYYLSTEPLTLQAILTHYQLQFCEGIYCLWKRQAQPQIEVVENPSPVTTRWNEWFAVPEHGPGAMRARLKAKRTWLGKLNLLLWKEGGIDIDYHFSDGTTQTYALPIENAVSGVWISPYYPDHLGKYLSAADSLSREQMQTILSRPHAQGNLERIEKTSLGWRVVGWAAALESDTRTQSQYVMLYNSHRQFLLPAQKYNRSDVADYFQRSGIVMTGQCGYYEELLAETLPPGEYRIRLVIRVGDQWQSTPDQGTVIAVDEGARSNRVLSARVRTTRPWAFDKDIQLQWQELRIPQR